MDLKQLKSKGANLSASQQAAFFYARRRRRERENANASEFKVKGGKLGVSMTVVLHTQ